MNSFFIVLLFMAIVALIVGIANPSLLRMESSKKAGLVFGSIIVVLFIFVGATSGPTTPSTISVAPIIAPDATTASIPTPESTPTTPAIPAPKKIAPAPVAAPQPTPGAETPSAPAPVYKPTTLLSISGSGSKSTQTFTAPTNSWQLNYTYDCSSLGSPGNFQVYIDNSDGSMSDAEGVNELGISGSDTEYYHESGSYYLEVNSECSWTINVKG